MTRILTCPGARAGRGACSCSSSTPLPSGAVGSPNCLQTMARMASGRVQGADWPGALCEGLAESDDSAGVGPWRGAVGLMSSRGSGSGAAGRQLKGWLLWQAR